MDERAEVISTENQRLRSEVRWLRKRLADMEASRWWRLNPKLLARTVIRRRSNSHGEVQQTVQPYGSDEAKPDTPTELVERFRAEVVERGSFSEEWFTREVDTWEGVMRDLAGRAIRALEIGSLEGLSACYLLWRLPDAQLTCIDTFAGSPEYATTNIDFSELEAVFDHNVALIDASRVRKLVGDSRRMLVDLEAEGGRFDLVFVDGSHFGLDVTVDAVLSWQLLNTQGIMIFDDYRWSWPGTDRLERPGPAIDAFLSLIDGKYELLFKDYQVGIRKTAD